jgi:hypothetical protein
MLANVARNHMNYVMPKCLMHRARAAVVSITWSDADSSVLVLREQFNDHCRNVEVPSLSILVHLWCLTSTCRTSNEACEPCWLGQALIVLLCASQRKMKFGIKLSILATHNVSDRYCCHHATETLDGVLP